MHAGRTSFGVDAAKTADTGGTIGLCTNWDGTEVEDPNGIVPVYGDAPRNREPAAGEGRPRMGLMGLRLIHRDRRMSGRANIRSGRARHIEPI